MLKNRQKRSRKQRISKEAKRYFAFWKIVNEVKSIVQDISNKEYPNIPTYLTIDHFWHWVKVIWSKEKHITPNNNNRSEIIKNLFNEYCQWDKLGNSHTKLMWETSKNIFVRYLSKEKIDSLTKEQAKEIYRNFHFGKKQTKRFKTDEKLVKENSILEIRQLLNYLLYSKDDLELRIHNLIIKEPKYKVKYFGNSAIQEVVGWVNPDLYPIRNEKADDAIKMLGYDIDGYIT